MVGIGSPSKNRGEHQIFADLLRTADDKHGYHLSNMNNHHPNIINLIRKHRDVKVHVRYRHANEHTALKRLGGDFTGRKKGSLFTGPYLKSLSLST